MYCTNVGSRNQKEIPHKLEIRNNKRYLHRPSIGYIIASEWWLDSLRGLGMHPPAANTPLNAHLLDKMLYAISYSSLGRCTVTVWPGVDYTVLYVKEHWTKLFGCESRMKFCPTNHSDAFVAFHPLREITHCVHVVWWPRVRVYSSLVWYRTAQNSHRLVYRTGRIRWSLPLPL